MLRIGWLLRVPSMIYFEWMFESVLNNSTKPDIYFLHMMQSMFIVPETGKDVFPAINLVLQLFLSIIGYVVFISVAIFNLKLVRKLYIFLGCIMLFVIGCNQYKLILYKLNGSEQLNAMYYDNINNSIISSWNIFSIDFVQFVPVSQFRSASLIFILPIIYCPWLIFVQYFNLMSNHLLALSYGIANLPGLCLALNLPAEAQIFTYNFAVTSFIIANIYKIVVVCIELPRTVTDLFADIFVLINFNHHEAALIEVPSVLWSLFSLSRQFIVFWCGLFFTHFVFLLSSFPQSLTITFLAAISESIQSPLGFIGFSVVSCYMSRFILQTIDWVIESDQFRELSNSHGIAEGFSTLIMMLSLNRSLLRVKNHNLNSSKLFDLYGKNGTSPSGLIVLVMLIILSSIIESASEMIGTKLLHLTATASTSRKLQKHVIPLVTGAILFSLPFTICISLCYHFTVDFWLLTIMGSFLMSSIHLLNSFSVYLIYMNNINSIFSNRPLFHLKWDTEDVILYLNVFVQLLEVIIAVALISLLIMRALNGHWNMVSMMLLIVHFYFNIFERVKTGWNQYFHRQMVTKKIASMYSVVDKDELKRIEDICAICYNDFNPIVATATTQNSPSSVQNTDNKTPTNDNVYHQPTPSDSYGPVKRTICRHYFHKVCLRKWLLIKHSCPMCSRDFNSKVGEDNGDGSSLTNIDREMHESDTESLASSHNDEDIVNDDYDFERYSVTSTDEVSSIYDDKDIDLKVYQELDSDGELIRFRQGRSSSSLSSSLNSETKDPPEHEEGVAELVEQNSETSTSNKLLQHEQP